MERLQVEGVTFHPVCFKCSHCSNKLSLGSFSRSDEGKYYCKVHYRQLFSVRGRYDFSTGGAGAGSLPPSPSAGARPPEDPGTALLAGGAIPPAAVPAAAPAAEAMPAASPAAPAAEADTGDAVPEGPPPTPAPSGGEGDGVGPAA